MKKFVLLIGFIAMVVAFMPLNVSAQSSNTEWYGTMSWEELKQDNSSWIPKSDGSGYYIRQDYSITKTSDGGYVYIEFEEKNNVKVSDKEIGGAFDLVYETKTTNGVAYLLKTKDGQAINGVETSLISVIADIVDVEVLECALNPRPLSPNCAKIGDTYLDNTGKEISASEYAAACESKPNDVPTPETGSVIPYIAIGGGLVAIALVYFYSRRSNKMYKL